MPGRLIAFATGVALALLSALGARSATPPQAAAAASIVAPARIPERCRIYQRQLTAEARTVFGLNAPVATLAGQVMQESTCNPAARSPVGAGGLTQFMPLTAADLARLYPTELGPADVTNPRWALAAQARYMRDLMRARERRDGRQLPECAAWWLGLRDYNGGAGWTERDRRLARADLGAAAGDDPLLVERYNAGRSGGNHRENTEYPRRILLRWGPAFQAAAWGRNVDCEG